MFLSGIQQLGNPEKPSQAKTKSYGKLGSYRIVKLEQIE